MPDGASSDHPAVQKQLDRLSLLSPGRDILGLDRISAVMKKLRNPHHRLPPVFHVAGTNGKGSTCAFLRAAIEAEGLKCHVYTSPHLVRFNERIRLAGHLIEDDYLAELLEQVLDASSDIAPSFFETTTAAALLAFADTPADACILEVGLGGRLDATNIIDHPVATGIAALGIDHESFLLAPEKGTPSEPIVRIAWEKAGIAKKSVPLLTQHYPEKMDDVIAAHCDNVGAHFLPRGEEWHAAIYEAQLHYRDAHGRVNLPLPDLVGSHQADNAALAVAMLRHQDAVQVSESALKAAMGWAQWPGRMHMLLSGPLTSLLPGDAEIWVDGGHNVSAGLALAKHFADHEAGSIHLIIGMLANKNVSAILSPLKDKLASVTVVPVAGHDSHPASAFSEFRGQLSESADTAEALERLKVDANATVLISGSLYLAGDVLRANHQVPD
ncbi:MAG: bifunctional folylpolyglutamate synthase/dihydrofolate synthase [Pseudomonadota bacterium]